MAPSKYQPLQQQESDMELEQKVPPCLPIEPSNRSSRAHSSYLAVLIITSLSINAIFTYRQFQTQLESISTIPTDYDNKKTVPSFSLLL